MQLSDVYRGVTKASVVAGDTILFWKDEWNDTLLEEAFPRAFSFARDQDMSVKKLLSSTSLRNIFHLPLSIEARLEVTKMQLATAVVASTEGIDTWSCVWGGSEFKASKFYEHCFRNMQVDEAFCWIWKSKCTM